VQKSARVPVLSADADRVATNSASGDRGTSLPSCPDRPLLAEARVLRGLSHKPPGSTSGSCSHLQQVGSSRCVLPHSSIWSWLLAFSSNPLWFWLFGPYLPIHSLSWCPPVDRRVETARRPGCALPLAPAPSHSPISPATRTSPSTTVQAPRTPISRTHEPTE